MFTRFYCFVSCGIETIKSQIWIRAVAQILKKNHKNDINNLIYAREGCKQLAG